MVWPDDGWRSIWYGLAGMALYMVWPDDACRSKWYSPAGMALYMVWPGVKAWRMVWPGGHSMVYGIWFGLVGMT